MSKRKFSLMCDKCKNITEIEIEFPYKEYAELCRDENNSIIQHRIITNCKYCYNESVDIVIDDSLSELISLLNKNDVKTTGCCSGHEEQSRMYIAFNLDSYYAQALIFNCFDKWNIKNMYLIDYDYQSKEERDSVIRDTVNKVKLYLKENIFPGKRSQVPIRYVDSALCERPFESHVPINKELLEKYFEIPKPHPYLNNQNINIENEDNETIVNKIKLHLHAFEKLSGLSYKILYGDIIIVGNKKYYVNLDKDIVIEVDQIGGEQQCVK